MNVKINEFIHEIIKKYNLVQHDGQWNYYVFKSELEAIGYAIFFDNDGVYIADYVDSFGYSIHYEINHTFFFYNEEKPILNHLDKLYHQFKIVNIKEKINNINSLFK